MKLTTFILILSLMQVSAASFGQKVTLREKNVTLERVFREIRKQTGYDVLLSTTKFNTSQKINANFVNSPLEQVIQSVVKGTELTYTIADNAVVIKEKERSFLDNVIARFQQIEVRGKVVDSLGNGIAGATVSVKGGKGSTSCDARGNFSLTNVEEGSVLVVSYLGYVTKEVGVNKDFTSIQLQQSMSKLDEVKVIAYGSTTQRLATGNSQGIKAEDIAKQPVNNPLYALQGRVAGLQVTPSSGLAGAPVKIEIRGRNTMREEGGDSADPLVVIDGLPVQNTIPSLGHANLLSFSSLNFINPSDIESIDVLKDADATSIYGSRGANGVILITTKKGKSGDMKVNINVQNGIGHVPVRMDLMGTEQYLALRREAFANSGVNLNTVTKTASRADVLIWDQNRDTDWQNKLIGSSAYLLDAQLSISGGNERVQYAIGGNYHQEKTAFAYDNSDKKGSMRLNVIGVSKNQKLKANLNAIYMSDQNNLPGIDFTRVALTLSPNAPELYKEDGSLNWEPLPSGNRSWNNPMAELSKTYRANVGNLIASTDLSYQIFNSLNFKSQFSINKTIGDSFRKIFPFEGRSPEELNLPASSYFNDMVVSNVNFEPQLNFNKKIGRGTFTALIGGAYQSSSTRDRATGAHGFTSDALLENLQSATSYTLFNNSAQYRYIAVFGRLNYNWANKYIINLSARRDGSSRFGPGKQFGNFGSTGVAWIFSEERFLKGQIPVLSFGKLRFSYGSAGNDGIGDYKFLERYQPIGDVYTPYQGVRGYRTYGLYNQYFAWEVTRKMEAGIDLGFFSDRILLNAVYFSNRSDNQLLNMRRPSMAGPGEFIGNSPALIQNMGIEFSASSTNLETKQFSWRSNLNFSRNRNKLIAFPGQQEGGYYNSLEIGQPFTGFVRLYKSAGVDPQTGRYQFLDVNGNITSQPNDPNRTDGGKFIRATIAPKFYGGLGNTITYKRFSIDFFVQFCKQSGINPMTLNGYLQSAGLLSNLPVEFESRWKKQGDQATYQKVVSTVNVDLYNASQDYAQSDFGIVDASFVRLKNVSMSYDLASIFGAKRPLRSARIFLQGQNVFTWTNYKGLDPETQSLGVVPPLRVITGGINVTF